MGVCPDAVGALWSISAPPRRDNGSVQPRATRPWHVGPLFSEFYAFAVRVHPQRLESPLGRRVKKQCSPAAPAPPAMDEALARRQSKTANLNSVIGNVNNGRICSNRLPRKRTCPKNEISSGSYHSKPTDAWTKWL